MSGGLRLWAHDAEFINWHPGDQCQPATWTWNNGPITCRPLVVIDPEDAEQVRALANAWDDLADKSAGLIDIPMTLSAMRMRAALRELASPTPLKPPEPQGQGAVIEDAQGVRWVRVEPTNPDITAWVAAWTGTVDDPQPADYDDISAVRVLSEGIQRKARTSE